VTEKSRFSQCRRNWVEVVMQYCVFGWADVMTTLLRSCFLSLQDGYMFPDGTPVSHVEAAVIRNFTRGNNEFLYFNNFLPPTHLFVNDRYLCLLPSDHPFEAELPAGAVRGARS
jgi:hypothetical protein